MHILVFSIVWNEMWIMEFQGEILDGSN